MFEWLAKSHVATVANINSKTKIIYALNAANIRYYLKCRDINRYSATKRGRIGKIGIKPKYVTEIFVDKCNFLESKSALLRKVSKTATLQ